MKYVYQFSEGNKEMRNTLGGKCTYLPAVFKA